MRIDASPLGVHMDIVERIHKLESLLSSEGPRSKRAFALFCAERVAYLNTDPRIVECLVIVRRRVADPASVTDIELKRASADVYAVHAADAYAAYAADASAADAAAYTAAADAAATATYAAYAASYAADVAASRDTRNMERRVQEAWLVFTNGFVSFPS